MLSNFKFKWLLMVTLALAFREVNCGTEEEALQWLEDWEYKFSLACHQMTEASWTVGINHTDETVKAQHDESEKFTHINAVLQKELLEKFPNWKEFTNKRLKRAMKFLAIGGPANMPMERVIYRNKMVSKFEADYGMANVCRFNKPTECNVNLKDIDTILKTSNDTKEMEYYFTAWHDKMSSMIPPEKYSEFVDLLTEYANANGFQYETELIMLPYDDESEGWTFNNFKKIMVGLAEDISRLYMVLHAYVRMKLRDVPAYKELISENKCGYLPAHIFGNMYAQDWTSLNKHIKPHPNAPELDATEALKKKGYTPKKMFEESDKFFKDMGLNGVGGTFWERSVLEKPADREIICHATAWDMCMGKGNTDFRIRQCTIVNQKQLIIAHHEMGHIEYFQQYTDLEFPFRTSANPGFHEAIGDALALAVVTPAHLQCKLHLDLGFPPSFCEQQTGPFKVTETDINYLFFIALDKLAFFPWSLSIDFWRFEVFEGTFKKEDYNKMWWEVRKQIQGIIPPGDRGSNPKLFDPAAKWHIPTNVDYLRYYVSAILTFQFYEALCITSGEYKPGDPNSKPLYQCDFAGSKEAGTKFANMMKLGFSKGWPDALEVLTGTRELSIKPFQHYLQPVLDYMEKELKANGEIIGFGDSCEEVLSRKGKSMWASMVHPEHKPANQL